MADKPKSEPGGPKPDLATIGGLLLAVVGIVGGLLLEGGELHDITQVTAAIIVLGGTIGAVLITTPLATFLGAMRDLRSVFLETSAPIGDLVQQLADYATRARKQGIVSLEEEAGRIKDGFLRKALMLGVDGTDIQEMRKMLELQIGVEEHHAEARAKVFEAAGGYAPTIGIIGAVLGLIQVMKNLSDIDKVGHGIAVSFVATVYGVAVSNLFFLPAAAKLKARAAADSERKELIVEGIVGIVEGLNPKLLASKLQAYAPHAPAPAADAKKAKPSAEAA